MKMAKSHDHRELGLEEMVNASELPINVVTT
jgi:hypothetical protein